MTFIELEIESMSVDRMCLNLYISEMKAYSTIYRHMKRKD